MTARPPLGELTPDQKRRAHALWFAREVLPASPHQVAVKVAHWILTGGYKE